MEEEAGLPVHNPHDKFSKRTFSQLETARDFFRTYLPPRLAAAVDWSTLALEPGSFVDERLAGSSSDLLYRVRCGDQPLLLYCLLEHQSTVDPDMPFRLLVYMVRIWERWRGQGPGEQKAPGIVPVVLHQGGETWTVSPRFQDWLGLPEAWRRELAPFQPDFEHVLVDLSGMGLEEVRGELVLRLVLSLMKSVREGRLEEWLERLGPSLKELLAKPDGLGIFRTLMLYAFAAEGGGLSTAANL